MSNSSNAGSRVNSRGGHTELPIEHRIPFRDELANWCRKKSIKRRDIAHIARVSEKDVVKWERGLAVPSKQQLQRLCAAHYAFNVCRLPSKEEIQIAQEAERTRRGDGVQLVEAAVLADAAVANEETPEPVEPVANDEQPPASAPKRAFRIALSEARTKEQLSIRELADLVGTSPRSLGRWEEGEAVPKPAYYQMLVQLLPDLADAELPPTIQVTPDEPEEITPNADDETTRRIVALIETKLSEHPQQVIASIDMQKLIDDSKEPRSVFTHTLRSVLGMGCYRVGFGGEGAWYWSKRDFRQDEAVVAQLKRTKSESEETEMKHRKNEERVLPAKPAQVYAGDAQRSTQATPVVVTTKYPRLSEQAPVDGIASAAASRALSAAMDQSPIRLPFVPKSFTTKRFVPRHAIRRFQERYLYGHRLRFSDTQCTYLIDYLVESAIQAGFFEWIREGDEQLRVVAVPGLGERQAFLFLVRENQLASGSQQEVVLTCVPEEDQRRTQISSHVAINTPFRELASEWQMVLNQVPTRKPPPPSMTVTSGTGINRPSEASDAGIPPTPPAPPPSLTADLPEDPIEAGAALGQAIKEMRDAQARLAELRKALDDAEQAVERAQGEVKRRQNHLLGLH